MENDFSLICFKKLDLIYLLLVSKLQYAFSQKPPNKNASLPVEQRVSDLLSRMTLEEKIAQMSMRSLYSLKTDSKDNITKESLEQLFHGEDIGCLESPFIGVNEIAKRSKAAENYLKTKTRLGIPAIQIAECLHGQLVFGSIIFPQAIAQGSSWNPELVRKMRELIDREASLSGVDQGLSPLFDLARDPRFGRVEECFGEGPFHVAEIGKAFVIGIQGDTSVIKYYIPDCRLMCTAKHYVGYSNSVAGIKLSPVEMGIRSLRNFDLYPFEKIVKEANIYSVIPAYNEVNGIPAHSNIYLLRDVLRKEYDFKGYVFSYYGGIAMLENFNHTVANKKEAAIQSLNTGVDLEAPGAYAYGELAQLAKEGKLDMILINESVRNKLTMKFKAGLFDKTYKAPKDISIMIQNEEAILLAREIAEESITLLKNENGLLAINISNLNKIAVIGPNADQVQYGDYSCTKDNAFGTTKLEGIKNIVINELTINYAQGCSITALDKTGFVEAIRAPKESDAVVWIIGETSSTLSGIGWGSESSDDYPTCGEEFDRAKLRPPGVQRQLIQAIARTGKPVVKVMVYGIANDIAWEIDHIPVILNAWYSGEQGGNVVASILFGIVNPSGKLTVTNPQSIGHIPVFYNHKPSERGFYKNPGTIDKPGRDYDFHSPEAFFPFAFGLSYTRYEYINMTTEKEVLNESNTIRLSVNIKNTEKVKGKEVEQLYINDKISSVTTPIKSLKGFKKVELEPEETKILHFRIPCSEPGLWEKDMN
jgi:beta-glucosidase